MRPVGSPDVPALPESGRGRTVSGMTETGHQGGGTAAEATWDCEAYGPEGKQHGALCFFSEGTRVCRTAAECSERMTGERRRVFGVITEGAAAGDPVMTMLAEEFTSPDQLLGGPEAPPFAGDGPDAGTQQ